MTEHEVIIAGAGPTGLMLAAELSLAGVDVAVIERRENQMIDGSRAGGLHARTIEILDQRGIADRFLREGQTTSRTSFAWIPLDIGDLPTRHNYTLALWQRHIERIMAGWVDELSVPIYRGREVTGFVQNDIAVDVQLADAQTLRAHYLVGCDGGRSIVRKIAGIEFAGSDPTTSQLIAEVELAREPPWGMHHDARGIHGFGKLDDGRVRVMVTEQHLKRSGQPALRDLSEALIAVFKSDFGVCAPTWISSFTDMARQAVAYRDRRVLLAGDAAHVHPPVGGQGLNSGVQDAVNLGWKLAQVVKQQSPEGLLDTYHAERHPVAARVIRNTMAQVALLDRLNERVKALRETMTELLSMDEPRKQYGAMMAGLDIRYDFGDGHPLLGRRMPDLDLVTASGRVRLFALLHDARPVLLSFGESESCSDLTLPVWAKHAKAIDATYDGAWELPAIGSVTAPIAVLIRPDGYVAWVGKSAETSLSGVIGSSRMRRPVA
jgi:2-polyprenyl-6-methoxyphenol hydroxylase-like FAD-dependent oxidoreductase